MTLLKPAETIIDFITSEPVVNIGAEENRQAVLRYLVLKKGYEKPDIKVNMPLRLVCLPEPYLTRLDIVIELNGIFFMVIKCAAGSLGSREREALSAARIMGTYQTPYSAVSDGNTAVVLDTISGKKIGEGMDALLSKQHALADLKTRSLIPLSAARLEKEALIFRSYDSMNINRVEN